MRQPLGVVYPKDFSLTTRFHEGHRAPEATRLFCKPCRELAFDFLVRHGFPSFNLIQPLADGGEKFQPFGDGVQTRIIWQALDRFQRKLFIAHAPTLHERGAKCNGRNPSSRAKLMCWRDLAGVAE